MKIPTDTVRSVFAELPNETSRFGFVSVLMHMMDTNILNDVLGFL